MPDDPARPDDADDEIMWSCAACDLLVVDRLHCPACGMCAPWGCGMDHEEEEDGHDDPDYGDPIAEAQFETAWDDAFGPPHHDVEEPSDA